MAASKQTASSCMHAACGRSRFARARFSFCIMVVLTSAARIIRGEASDCGRQEAKITLAGRDQPAPEGLEDGIPQHPSVADNFGIDCIRMLTATRRRAQ